jgi:hypothetical protein
MSDFIIAFSINPMIFFSNGVIIIVLASGVVMLATFLTAVCEP